MVNSARDPSIGRSSLTGSLIRHGLTAVVTLILIALNPLGQRLARFLDQTICGPDVDVNIRSILVSKQINEDICSVKLILEVRSSSDNDLTVVPLVLEDRALQHYDFAAIKDYKINVAAHQEVTDTFSFYSKSFDAAFRRIPFLAQQDWAVTWRVRDHEGMAVCNPSNIDRFHYLLLPKDSILVRKQDQVTYAQYQHVLYRQITDSTGKSVPVRKVVSFIVYPVESVGTLLDVNGDGEVDEVVQPSLSGKVDTLRAYSADDKAADHTLVAIQNIDLPGVIIHDSLAFGADNIVGLQINFEQFQRRDGGIFIFLPKAVLDFPPDMIFEAIGADTAKEIYRFFGEYVDQDIIRGQQFIYLSTGT